MFQYRFKYLIEFGREHNIEFPVDFAPEFPKVSDIVTVGQRLYMVELRTFLYDTTDTTAACCVIFQTKPA